jgi:hypothetical protein
VLKTSIQQRLPFNNPEAAELRLKLARLRLSEQYRTGNLEAAVIILADEKYVGVMQEWARITIGLDRRQ